MFQATRFLRSTNFLRLLRNQNKSSVRFFSSFKPSQSKDEVKNPPTRKSYFSYSTTDVKEHPIEVTKEQKIQADTGLQRFIQKSYLFAGGSVVGCIGISSLLAQSPIIAEHPFLAVFFGLVGSYAGFVGVAKSSCHISKDVFLTDGSDSLIVYSSSNSIQRLSCFGFFLSSVSVGISPLFTFFPETILPSVIASSTVFGCSMIYSYFVSGKEFELSPWKSAFTISALSLVGITVMSFGSNLILGPDSFLTNSYLTTLGIPFFALLVALDTDEAIEMYKKGQPDHLSTSLINLIPRLLDLSIINH